MVKTHFPHYPSAPIPQSLDFRFVNVTPAPVLAWFEGLDDRMPAYMKMFPRVPIG
jgi:hypothetical protein